MLTISFWLAKIYLIYIQHSRRKIYIYFIHIFCKNIIIHNNPPPVLQKSNGICFPILISFKKLEKKLVWFSVCCIFAYIGHWCWVWCWDNSIMNMMNTLMLIKALLGKHIAIFPTTNWCQSTWIKQLQANSWTWYVFLQQGIARKWHKVQVKQWRVWYTS